MRESHLILLASTNHDKLIEFRALLRAEFPDTRELDIVLAEKVIRNAEKLAQVERYETYLENAMAKARHANMASHYPCLADDSGLEVEALNGQPGVRSHRYAIPKAGVSQAQANVDKLLGELKGRVMAQRNARFVCALALVMEGIMIHSTGILEGTIAEAPLGKGGFGYDPIFIPKGFSKTLAEMTEDEKNRISHRAVAFRDLAQQIRKLRIQFARP